MTTALLTGRGTWPRPVACYSAHKPLAGDASASWSRCLYRVVRPTFMVRETWDIEMPPASSSRAVASLLRSISGRRRRCLHVDRAAGIDQR